MDIKKKNMLNLLYGLIVILFILLSVYVAIHHEYWADEAHAWLMARDCSIVELLTKYIHSDGHPILWFLVIKMFQSWGLKYDYFFIISVIFSTLGVFLFVFFSKYPWYIKITLPFTYFIFYQYTVVVRGYCLLFFILNLIAITYDKRHSKIYLYSFLLLLLLSTEAYTFLFAGMLYLIYCYEFIKNRDGFSKKDKIKHIICLTLLFISFCLTVLYIYPYSTNTFNPTETGYRISDSFFTIFNDELSTLNLNSVIAYIGTLFIVILLLKIFINEKKKVRYFFLLITPVYLFLSFKYYRVWHLGIMFLIFIFIFWIFKLEKNKYVLLLLILSIWMQLFWSFCCVNFDLNNNYSGAKDAAYFIKENGYDDLKVFGSEFYSAALNPYFSSNIYDNWDDKGFFYWDSRCNYYSLYEITDNYNGVNEYAVEYILSENYDIVVLADESKFEYFDGLLEKYNYYDFGGKSYVENFEYEDQTYRVFVRKDIDKGRE